MLLSDEALWRGQRAEADDEYGEGFLDFVESWCGRAEQLVMTDALAAEVRAHGEDPGRAQRPSPVEALRETLNPTEAERGVLPPGWTAQMLLVIAACWRFGGPGLFEGMTTFEKKMVADMAAAVGVEVVPDGGRQAA